MQLSPLIYTSRYSCMHGYNEYSILDVIIDGAEARQAHVSCSYIFDRALHFFTLRKSQN